MIIDDFLNTGIKKIPPNFYNRSTLDIIRREAVSSHRFAFDAAASELAGRLAFEASDLVIDHRQFAIPPYHSTYIEVDGGKFFNSKQMIPSLRRLDQRFSYLFVGPHVYEFSASDDGCAMGFFRMTVVPPGQSAGPDKMTIPFKDGRSAVMGQDFKLAIMLGSAANQRRLDDDHIDDEVSFEWLIKPFPREARAWVSFFAEWAGTIRNAWSLLLWLNQPARLRMENVGPSRSITHGKLRTYRAHNIVTIDLNKKYLTIRKAFLEGADRTPPRRHEVRGSFHHHGGLITGCGHVWPMIPDLDGVWTCSKCQRRRWWVKDHMRGDATRGFVTKEYDTVVKKETAP